MYDSLKRNTDFSIRIIWKGNEDKPFYRAHFVSESQNYRLSQEPFWANAIISTEEYLKLLGVLEESGIELPQESGRIGTGCYCIEIQTGEQIFYGLLGAPPQALPILNSIGNVLDVDHVRPIRQIIDRLGGFSTDKGKTAVSATDPKF